MGVPPPSQARAGSGYPLQSFCTRTKTKNHHKIPLNRHTPAPCKKDFRYYP
ncbi:MAG: hypothetical protein LBQ31_11585 [Bacteroidales bacterium]|nr:hypothetical protein [Bacteroidales bacterium]